MLSVLVSLLCLTVSGDAISDLVFCVLSEEELAKCEALAAQTLKDQEESDITFGSYFRTIGCTDPFPSREDCMHQMDSSSPGAPTVMVVDAGDLFVGGRYHSLVPILREVYEGGRDFYQAVAVIKKGSLPGVRSLADLRNKRACFAGVGTQAGWTIPLYNLVIKDVLPVTDCNNYVKSTSDFFAESCAVNTLQDRNNPLGDNSNKLCEICGSQDPGVRCTVKDPYAGFRGAMLCLQDKGDIAFVKHNTLEKLEPDGVIADDHELLCTDGTRAEIADYASCSWGVAPGHFVIVSSAMDPEERKVVQRFLVRIMEKYRKGLEDVSTDAIDESSPHEFDINESVGLYGNTPDLLFNDDAMGLEIIEPEEQLYKNVLEKSYGSSLISPAENIHEIRRCPIQQMRMCVTSEPEFVKCQRMRVALHAQLLKPRMTCLPSVPPYSHRRCMELVARKKADVTMLEAGDIYRAGKGWGLIPIMAEVYNLGTPDYYAVAVVKIGDNSSELIYLKRRNSCHTGLGQGAGWIIPMSWLITNERVRDYGCDSVRAAAEYFSKSCAPGVRNPEYVSDRVYTDRNYWHYGHLCDLCHGTAAHYCDRTAMEDFYGNTGAFRCLVEGGGDVAFVKHTTVMENCDGKRKEIWARNQLTADYQLLCRDGTRKKATEYRDCYLGKVKANAMITNPFFPKKTIDAFINLFKYAQQFYGQKMKNEFSFSMFYSEPPYADLIFQDAAQKIIVLPEEERHYLRYLGPEFAKAFEEVECFNCCDVMWCPGLLLTLILTLVLVNRQ